MRAVFFLLGIKSNSFLGQLNLVAKANTFTAVLRTHLNSRNPISLDGLTHVVAMPSDLLVNAEELLSVLNVLDCDWSSIAFDFLFLQRPTIFLDMSTVSTKHLFACSSLYKTPRPPGFRDSCRPVRR